MINKVFVKTVANRKLNPDEVKLLEFINGLEESARTRHGQALTDLLSAAEAKGFRDGRDFERSEKQENEPADEPQNVGAEIEEIKAVCTMIPKFIQTVENDLGEDQHIIEGDPLTFKDFDRIQHFAIKLKNCINHVDVDIFE